MDQWETPHHVHKPDNTDGMLGGYSRFRGAVIPIRHTTEQMPQSISESDGVHQEASSKANALPLTRPAGGTSHRP